MSLLVEAYDRYSEHTALDGEGIELAMEFELLALECGADPKWDRQRLVRFERSRKGGLATLARYGHPYYRALARARWGKTPKGALPTIREILRQKPPEPTPRPTPRPMPKPMPEPTPEHEHRPENPDEGSPHEPPSERVHRVCSEEASPFRGEEESELRSSTASACKPRSRPGDGRELPYTP